MEEQGTMGMAFGQGYWHPDRSLSFALVAMGREPDVGPYYEHRTGSVCLAWDCKKKWEDLGLSECYYYVYARENEFPPLWELEDGDWRKEFAKVLLASGEKAGEGLARKIEALKCFIAKVVLVTNECYGGNTDWIVRLRFLDGTESAYSPEWFDPEIEAVADLDFIERELWVDEGLSDASNTE